MHLSSTTRPLTEKEVRLLKSKRASLIRQGSRYERRLFFVFPILFGVLSMGAVLGDRRHQASWIGAFLVLGLFTSLSVIIPERRRRSSRVRSYDDAIARGTCDERRIVVRRFWDFKEQEDEGACYAFEMQSGGVVFVTGQEYYPEARFPNSDFSLIEFRDRDGELIDSLVEKRGSKISPERVFDGKEREVTRNIEHSDFFEGSLEEMYELLKRSNQDSVA